MVLGHGGDWRGFLEKNGVMPLDFSASVSPLGLPAGVREAVVRSLSRADLYPDPMSRDLTRDLSRYHGVSDNKIVCGAGASDIIERLLRALKPSRVMVTAPAFSGYTEALAGLECDIEEYTLSDINGFRVDEGILGAIDEDTDVLFLCEPNNPTGVCTERDLLLRIADRCRETGTLLAVDECFNDFLEDPEGMSMLSELERCPMLVIRAFTKFYAMPGLRLGYGISDDVDLIDKMKRAGQPWAVSVMADAAGRAALHEEEYGRVLKKLIKEERMYLLDSLKRLGMGCVQGEANFVFFESPVKDLGEKLQTYGIVIRDCSNFSGLKKGYYRAAVRTHEDNVTLISAMEEILK
ncbi:MAG: aminotransferase class I/II-fold pyridoxal phosphate-dependent enzyme [Christensenellaceae bacterium]|nr:aminotransferase class I/II-fold pyridoxal phosphate-dependent enzyme [Christensenellaceae bacterium]